MPLIKDREYRMMIPLTIPSEKRIESDFYVEGYATTFDKPYLMYEIDGINYYEMIDRHALDNADISDVILQYDHEGRVYARISNKTLFLEPNENGLLIYADLSKTANARNLYEDISQGMITKMSWAFTVAEDAYDRDTRTRIIKRIKKVYDTSAVSIPANPGTDISARSFYNGVIEREKQELLERRKKLLKLKLVLEEI